MYPSTFDYIVATSVEHALRLLEEHGEDAKLLAGGHSLLPLMKLRLAAPGVVIDIGRVSEISGIERRNGSIDIGALTTYAGVIDSPDLLQLCPLLVQTAHHVGDVQVRNRGTLGGSVAHADPAGDMPATMLALDATFTVRGPRGERSAPAAGFFQGPFTTDLAPDEMLTGITVPRLPYRSGTAYEKFRNPASGYAVVGIAAMVSLDSNGSVSDARLAITGAGSQPTRATGVEDALRGQTPDEAAVSSAAESIGDGLETLGDSYASPEYRLHLARVLARRALSGALQQARS